MGGAVAFGSMGRAGARLQKIADELTEAGFDVREQKEVYIVPDESELLACFEIGRRFAGYLRALVPAAPGGTPRRERQRDRVSRACSVQGSADSLTEAARPANLIPVHSLSPAV